MEKEKCKICGKEIEGYSKQHVEYMMMQHNLVHRNKEDKNGKKK